MPQIPHTTLTSSSREGTIYVRYLAVDVHVVDDSESLVIVTKQRVQTQQANKTKVSQHLVQSVTSKLTSYSQVLVCIACNRQQKQLQLLIAWAG